MNMWTAIMVIAIVAITSFARVIRARYLAEHNLVDDRRGNPVALPRTHEAELEREVSDLKKRLAVLERIATDDRQSKAIAQEIEALRDR
jgi:hypothetical protein